MFTIGRANSLVGFSLHGNVKTMACDPVMGYYMSSVVLHLAMM